MKSRKYAVPILMVVFIFLFPKTAYANSSWHWLTENTPFDILPYVVILTLIIEFAAIKILNPVDNSAKNTVRLLAIICFANLASFLLPYTIWLAPSAVGYTFEMSINGLPIYTVGGFYLFLTLLAEVPIVYFGLRNIVVNRKKLLASVICVNVITTVMVTFIEKIICRGSW